MSWTEPLETITTSRSIYIKLDDLLILLLKNKHRISIDGLIDGLQGLKTEKKKK